MKISDKGCLILTVVWLFVSLIWFLWIQNTAIGVVWLLCGMAELLIALLVRCKEKHK